MTGGSDDIYEYQPLWGNWKVEELIGSGSFGRVYRLSREEFGHHYNSAVKIITIPSDEQYKEAESFVGSDSGTLKTYFEGVVQNIANEVNILYSLSGNSNILGYQDHNVVERRDKVGWDILIKMEYVKPLRQYLAEKSLTRAEVVQLGIDMCNALEICSKRGVIHRDIKDENIFINEDGLFKLGDFGIARELTKSGRAATMGRGTMLYMAPEVYKGERYDAGVDIYSLGILLYKLLNQDRLPFMPCYPQKIVYSDFDAALSKRMAGEHMPLPVMAADKLGKAVVKACAYKPEERFTTAAEMKNALLDALSTMIDTEKSEEITLVQTKKEQVNRTEQLIEKKKSTESIFASVPHTTEPEKQQNEAKADVPHKDYEKTESVFGQAMIRETANNMFTKSVSLSNTSQKREKAKSLIGLGVVAFISFLAVIFLFNRNAFMQSSQSQDASKITPQITAQPAQQKNEKTVVAFEDKGIEAAVRESLNRPNGDIYSTELAQITEFRAMDRGIETINDLRWFTNLRVLDLGTEYSGNETTNSIEDISVIQKLVYLQELDLGNNQISDISAISKLKNLKRLLLYDNKISDIGPLAGLINISVLYINGNDISDIQPLSNLTNLTELVLLDNKISDISVLSKLTNLSYLYFGNNQISDISSLSNLIKLQELFFMNNRIKDISALSKLANLTRLGFSGNLIEDIKPLAELSKLNYLCISYNAINDISSLKKLTNLQELYLENNPIQDFTPVRNLPNITQKDW